MKKDSDPVRDRMLDFAPFSAILIAVAVAFGGIVVLKLFLDLVSLLLPPGAS
jgi:hypothetical protein